MLEALHDAKSEQIMVVFCAASWFPQNKKFFLDKAIENAVSPVAVGRKNYLFCQNDDTAESTAIVYSFMGCCKAAGADFRKWMIYFLDHLHDYDEDNTKDIADLLPDNLKTAGLI